MENAPSAFEGPVGQVFGDPGDIEVFAGLRDDPFVLDGQFFRIVAGSQDVFRNIPASPLGPLRGRPVRADGTSGIDTGLGSLHCFKSRVGLALVLGSAERTAGLLKVLPCPFRLNIFGPLGVIR